ncbi:hypothetical protein FB451DRAFT_1405572 [Mycena latifolia]|nr:hypothetical protein FB451DRAFT_1405572 [Mycena latifolia]
MDKPPAPFRSLHPVCHCRTPLYVLGWRLTLAEISNIMADYPNYKGYSHQIEGLLRHRWQDMILNQDFHPISTRSPQPLCNRDGTFVLQLFGSNARTKMETFKEHRDKIIEENIIFLGLDADMKNQLCWHQAPIKGYP